MPALFTHYNLGNKVLKNLSLEQQKLIKEEIEYYYIFNQGWDNLFYYPWKWQHYRKLAGKFHKENVDEFFKNIILYIKDNNYQDNSILTNYLFGFINHYIIDTIIHPFINYQVDNLNIPHSKIEFMIDTKIEKNIDGKSFKKTIPRVKFNDNLNDLINHVFLKTYNEKDIAKIMNSSHNYSYYLYRYFIKDSTGIKSRIYKLFDYISPFDIDINEYTYYYKEYNKKIDNSDKKMWTHPETNEAYNYSLKELFEYTVSIATIINMLAYDVLNDKESLNELVEKIGLIDINNIPRLLKR